MSSFTKLQICDALDEVVRRFATKVPDNDYDYEITRLANISDGSNWTVGATGTFIGPVGSLAMFENELDEVRRAMPIMS